MPECQTGYIMSAREPRLHLEWRRSSYLFNMMIRIRAISSGRAPSASRRWARINKRVTGWRLMAAASAGGLRGDRAAIFNAHPISFQRLDVAAGFEGCAASCQRKSDGEGEPHRQLAPRFQSLAKRQQRLVVERILPVVGYHSRSSSS